MDLDALLAAHKETVADAKNLAADCLNGEDPVSRRCVELFGVSGRDHVIPKRLRGRPTWRRNQIDAYEVAGRAFAAGTNVPIEPIELALDLCDDVGASLEAQEARERDVTDAMVRILAAGERHGLVDLTMWWLRAQPCVWSVQLAPPRWARVVRRWEAKHVE